jgi:hypothetical protein
MTKPVISVEPEKTITSGDGLATYTVAGKNIAGKTGLDHVHLACKAFATFGEFAGWGFVVLGLLFGALELMGGHADGLPDQRGWVRAAVEAAIKVLAFVLSGWALATLSSLLEAALLQYFFRASPVSERLEIQVAQSLALLERIAIAIEARGAPVASTPMPTLERAQAIAEVVRATRAADWVEAETRLSQLEETFPEDPELPSLRAELGNARDGLVKKSLAQLDAARGVNDPDRVLEIYQGLGPSLDNSQRTSLDQDLAKWFLSLIHRRLRTGKVQPDVVQLAARFAATFAATVEGASVRASLPTLRRSVGLCPRCAQPYTGVAEACPDCKKSAAQAVSAVPPADEMGLPG